jgi:hypothetical protein
MFPAPALKVFGANKTAKAQLSFLDLVICILALFVLAGCATSTRNLYKRARLDENTRLGAVKAILKMKQ